MTPRNSPVTFVTPAGEELVVLACAEYEALLAAATFDEDAADVALFDARVAQLDRESDLLPPGVSAHMLAGRRLVHALRLWRGLTRHDLAERTGLTQADIGDLEEGRRAGSNDALLSIASALAVPSHWLAPP